MAEKIKLKEIFEVETTLEPFYSDGPVGWSDDGKHLLCLCDEVVKVLLVDSRKVIRSIGGDSSEDAVISFCLGVGEFMHMLITSHESGLLKAWNWLDGTLERQWKHTHKGRLLKFRIRPYATQSPLPNTILVTAGSEGSLRLWDIAHGQCTKALHDQDYQGATSVVEWAESEKDCEIWASAFDYKIYIWSIISGEKIATLEGHYSEVIAIVFHTDSLHAISLGRDKIFILWDRLNKLSLRNFTIPDGPEALILLPSFQSIDHNIHLDNNGIYIMIATNKGFIRLMDAKRGCEIMSHHMENTIITGLLCCKSTGQIAYITSDQIIGIQQYLDPGTLKLTEDGREFLPKLVSVFEKEIKNIIFTSGKKNFISFRDPTTFSWALVGFNDEIIDLALLGENESLLAVASNSPDIKVFLLEDMSCWLLKGHKDHVLNLCASPVNPNLLVSSSKDSSIRLWIVAPNGILNKSYCVAAIERHATSVGAVCLSSSLMTSASQDGCLKLWSLPKTTSSEWEIELKETKIAHSKEINAIVINEKEKILCTCSADKTAKLWDASSLEPIGTLQGHRKGVWHASFYDQEQLIATASADTTIRIWRLTNLECLRTIEVSDSATLRCRWINSGQLITSSGDGVIRIWSLDTSQKKQIVWGGGKLPVALTEHKSRVWTFIVSSNEERIISGDADSKIIIWRNATESRLDEQAKLKAQLIIDEQQLANLRHLGLSSEALILAIKLNRPRDALLSITKLLHPDRNALISTIKNMDMNSKECLLKFASQWNTRSRECLIAAEIFSILLPELSLNKFSTSTTNSLLPGLHAYSKRHYERLSQTGQDLKILEYTIDVMQRKALN